MEFTAPSQNELSLAVRVIDSATRWAHVHHWRVFIQYRWWIVCAAWILLALCSSANSPAHDSPLPRFAMKRVDSTEIAYHRHTHLHTHVCICVCPFTNSTMIRSYGISYFYLYSSTTITTICNHWILIILERTLRKFEKKQLSIFVKLTDLSFASGIPGMWNAKKKMCH